MIFYTRVKHMNVTYARSFCWKKQKNYETSHEKRHTEKWCGRYSTLHPCAGRDVRRTYVLVNFGWHLLPHPPSLAFACLLQFTPTKMQLTTLHTHCFELSAHCSPNPNFLIYYTFLPLIIINGNWWLSFCSTFVRIVDDGEAQCAFLFQSPCKDYFIHFRDSSIIGQCVQTQRQQIITLPTGCIQHTI